MAIRAVLSLCLVGLAAVAAAAAAAEGDAGDLIGAVRLELVQPGDSLVAIAGRERLGFVELVAANPWLDPWLPAPGALLVLPEAHLLPDAPRRGLVVNLGDQRLYHYRPDGRIDSMAIGIGDEAAATPIGQTRVVRKQVRPVWYPPASIRAADPGLPLSVPPGPDNPLGAHALYLGWRGYLIHGTNRPLSIGRALTHGCIRLYPEDIAQLYAAVPVGTPVQVVDQPLKAGWQGGRLFLEVHPTAAQAVALETGVPPPAAATGGPAVELVAATARRRPGAVVDWEAVRRAVAEHRGLPVAVGDSRPAISGDSGGTPAAPWRRPAPPAPRARPPARRPVPPCRRRCAAPTSRPRSPSRGSPAR